MTGAAHDERRRGEGDQRSHRLHTCQHDCGGKRQRDDTGGVQKTTHSRPHRHLSQLNAPARRATRMWRM